MQTSLPPEVVAIQSLEAVPTILEAVAAITGLRFVCVAHVTADSWTTCAVLDQLNFGLKPGDGLDVTTTLCETVRDTCKAIIIDHVSEDEVYRNHHTPRIYGFESYISIPIFLPNGDYFGTLCGLDPLPINLNNKATVGSMTMFAQLISLQLANSNKLSAANEALLDERETAELREQFIAVLGHDLRNPLNAISMGAQILALMPDASATSKPVVEMIQKSANRMGALVDDVVDFARGRMGGGIGLNVQREDDIAGMLKQVVLELTSAKHVITSDIHANLSLNCDIGRIGQLLSNLLKNALVHGDAAKPIHVAAWVEEGIFKLSVTNAGVEMPENTRNQLFKPFWRASTTALKEGLGLGLFIVAEIARSHGGKIHVSSSNEETSFVFSMNSADFIERRKTNSVSVDSNNDRRQIF